jgi:hypothetical protein
MKLNSVATILANNADAFGRASIGAARAIAGGNLSNARAFSAEMVKLMQRGKQLKAIRRKQIKRWGSQNKRGRLTRLDARRMRMMKAIAELQRKEESDGLTPAEKTRMRDAQLGLRHVETNMIGITGGSGIPKAARKKLAMEGLGQTDYRMSVKDLQPVFSAKMGPLPKQGEFLSSFGATVIPAVDKRMRKKLARPLNPAGRFLGEDESFVAPSELGPVKFAVPMKPNDPSGQFLTDIMGDLSGNMVEDTSLGFLPMQRTKVPAFSTVKAMPPSMLKMAAESLPARSKRVGNILKRRARTLWNFSRIGANVLRRDKMTRMFEKSKATDVWRDIDLKQREKIEKRRVKRDLERFKRRHGRLPGLGELKPFSIPEAIWQEEKQLDGLGETVSTSSGYKPFSIPEAVWITKGFGDLLLM